MSSTRTYEDLNDIYKRFIQQDFINFKNVDELANYLESYIKGIGDDLFKIELMKYTNNPLEDYFKASKEKYNNMKNALNRNNFIEMERLLSFSLIFDSEHLFSIDHGNLPNKDYYTIENKFINDKIAELNKENKVEIVKKMC